MPIWFWIALVAIIAVSALLSVFAWRKGIFGKVLTGSRIIAVMIAIEVFGLLLMILGMIIYLANNDTYPFASVLMQIGLLTAVPAGIYFVLYFLYKMMQKNERVNPKNINSEWFDTQKQDAATREDQTHTLVIKLEQETQEKEQELKIVEEELRQTEQEIATGSGDSEQMAKLQEQRDSLESQKGVLSMEREAMSTEKQELEASRELLKKEQLRLEEDKKRLDELEQKMAGARDEEEASRFAEELASLKEEQRKQVEALESELGIARDRQQKALLARERRKDKQAEKRAVLSRENVQKHIRKYFVETAACFLMDRNAYKDRFGLSPYNRVLVTEAINPGEKEKVEHQMMGTVDKLYKFCELLIDVDSFFNHDKLFPVFEQLVDEGTSLVRISEKLHLLYLQFHKKDFVKDYRYKEDFENMLIMISHHYLVRGLNFRGLFKTFEGFDQAENLNPDQKDEIINFLSKPQLGEQFSEYFSNWADLGFETMHQALVVCYTDARKNNLSDEQLAHIILKDANKLAKPLARRK